MAPKSQLLSGGAALSVAMLLANAANYAANLITAQWADQAEFADATLVVTLFLGMTIFGVAIQFVAARRQSVDEHGAAVVWLRGHVVRGSALMTVALLAGAVPLQRAFDTESALPFVFLASAAPFYLIHAIDRGVLQGRLDLSRLSVTFVVEAVARLALTAALVRLGFGATGVAAALAVSTALSWLAGTIFTGTEHGDAALARRERTSLLADVRPTFVLLVGQVLINNADVVIVKAVQPDAAARYAGVALIGRAVFFLSWSIVTTAFPVAARADRDRASRLALGAAGTVAACGGALVAASAQFGTTAASILLGSQYTEIAPLLWRYGLATVAFAVTNVLASVDLARGNPRGPRLVLTGAVAQTALLLAVASRSLETVVNAQIVAMLALAAVAVAAHLREARSLGRIGRPAGHVSRWTREARPTEVPAAT